MHSGHIKTKNFRSSDEELEGFEATPKVSQLLGEDSWLMEIEILKYALILRLGHKVTLV